MTATGTKQPVRGSPCARSTHPKAATQILSPYRAVSGVCNSRYCMGIQYFKTARNGRQTLLRGSIADVRGDPSIRRLSAHSRRRRLVGFGLNGPFGPLVLKPMIPQTEKITSLR